MYGNQRPKDGVVVDVRAGVAVVIPCYRVRSHILTVIEQIGANVSKIYVVDDKCPENSGDYVEQECKDERVEVIRHQKNLGVGGATLSGYEKAYADGFEVVVKIDGDDQMDPAAIDKFVAPILNGEADYTKGNRFYDPNNLTGMPLTRLLGNAVLSFMTKLSSGYWDVFDPTNGYTAIHASLVPLLSSAKISRRFFFESDMLLRLNILRAVVADVPIPARYGNERSNLRIRKVIPEFIARHIRNVFIRLFFNYFLRNFSIASVELVLGSVLFLFGVSFGLWKWYLSTDIPSTSGTVMMAALPIILGFQMLLAFIGYDMSKRPNRPLHPKLMEIDYQGKPPN